MKHLKHSVKLFFKVLWITRDIKEAWCDAKSSYLLSTDPEIKKLLGEIQDM